MSKNDDKMKHHALLSLSDEKPSNITAKRTSLNPGMIQDFDVSMHEGIGTFLCDRTGEQIPYNEAFGRLYNWAFGTDKSFSEDEFFSPDIKREWQEFRALSNNGSTSLTSDPIIKQEYGEIFWGAKCKTYDESLLGRPLRRVDCYHFLSLYPQLMAQLPATSFSMPEIKHLLHHADEIKQVAKKQQIKLSRFSDGDADTARGSKDHVIRAIINVSYNMIQSGIMGKEAKKQMGANYHELMDRAVQWITKETGNKPVYVDTDTIFVKPKQTGSIMSKNLTMHKVDTSGFESEIPLLFDRTYYDFIILRRKQWMGVEEDGNLFTQGFSKMWGRWKRVFS